MRKPSQTIPSEYPRVQDMTYLPTLLMRLLLTLHCASSLPYPSSFCRSLELDPGNIKTFNNRGYSHAKNGNYGAAIEDYSRVIALDPGNSHAYHNRGISYDKMGSYEAAIADFTEVLKLDAGNANAYFNRGSTHDSLGAYDKAIADYTK